MKYQILIVIISIMVLLVSGCDKDDGEYIPVYQDAIYIMDADGSNKQKVIEVDGCCNVQFIPDSDNISIKILPRQPKIEIILRKLAIILRLSHSFTSRNGVRYYYII